MVLKIAIFQKNDRNLIGKIMHCAIVAQWAGMRRYEKCRNSDLSSLNQASICWQSS